MSSDSDIFDRFIEFCNNIKNGREFQFYIEDTSIWFGCEYDMLSFDNFKDGKLRLKPTPEKTPFDYNDIKPNMEFRSTNEEFVGFRTLIKVSKEHVFINSARQNDYNFEALTWVDLQKDYMWSTDGQTWHKCEKEAEDE